VRVVIADDHRIVREGIAMLLEPEADVDLVGEASSGEELLELLETTEVDIVLLDVRMPGKGGLEVLEELQS
jgi:DNA-binding NarL/FixJ family response regulator